MSSTKIKKQEDGVLYTRNLILRGICAVYLIAFLSFYYQSEGLYGDNGILPARVQINTIGTGKVSAIHIKPTLLHLSSFLGINTALMVDFLALLGALIAFTGFISQKFCLLPTFAALWSLYYSLTQVAQVFVHQSDLLLLEAGAICIILAPLNSHRKRSPIDKMGLLMMRWLLFRFMFASGAVKLASNCPHWWNLSALKLHFETMPLPTGLSWYAFHLPEHFLKLNVVFVNLSELIVPWLFLAPVQTLRKLAFYWQLFLQFHIIITGNYGLLNFLIVTLLFSLLNDSYFYGRKNKGTNWLNIIVNIVALGAIAFVAYYFYGIGWKNSEFTFKINFTKSDFSNFLIRAINASPVLPLIGIIGTFMHEMIRHPAIKNASSILSKFYTIFTAAIFLFICLTLIGLSTVPHRNLHKASNITNTEIGHVYQRFRHLNVVNEYGQHLRRMRSERLEIVLEHSQHIEGPWNDYQFLYKPWNVNHSLPFAGAYLPRLDFKFWDASVSNYNDQLWVSVLAYRLLQNEKSVLHLLGIKQPVKQPPKFVRAILYKFKYTPWKERDNSAYWIRHRLAEYFPAYSLEHAPLQAYLKSLRIPATYKAPPVKNQLLKTVLDFLRTQSQLLEGSFLIFGVLAAGFAIIASQKRQ